MRFFSQNLFLLMVMITSVSTASAGAVIKPFEVYAETREGAEISALIDVVQRALKSYMQEQALHPSIRGKIKTELNSIKPDHYKPLVKGWLEMEFDGKVKNKYILQGSVAIEPGVLKLWARKWLEELSQGDKNAPAALDHRLTVYVSPVVPDDLLRDNIDLDLRRELVSELESQLDHLGFEIKTKAKRQQSDYSLQLNDSRY